MMVLYNRTMFNRPIIPNANQYFLEKKYVSINSNDRDMVRHPNASEFEITLPQEYQNVASARLYSWSFPANYNVFSVIQYNVVMGFKLTQLYNPAEHGVTDAVTLAIYAALAYYGNNKNWTFDIEPGFYNPEQMATELTNKFNAVATNWISTFLNTPAEWAGQDYSTAANTFQRYDRFRVVYNAVTQKLWFGNTADRFVIVNDNDAIFTTAVTDANCLRKNMTQEWSNWGLAAYLGFSKCNAYSNNPFEFVENFPSESLVYTDLSEGLERVPRFYYGDAVPGSGDNGYWLLPTLPGATVYFLQAPFKISIMGQAYIYMEIDGLNCIDETAPYNLNKYTASHTNNNTVVNASFAKIAVPTTPISQWFDNDQGPYKYWNPPAERLSKLKIKMRYHNGMLVEFGQFEYSFMLELNLLKPQIERSYSIVNAFDLGQQQTMN